MNITSLEHDLWLHTPDELLRLKELPTRIQILTETKNYHTLTRAIDNNGDGQDDRCSIHHREPLKNTTTTLRK